MSETGWDKERAVQGMFSSIARYYDLNNTLLSFGLHHGWKRDTVRLAGIRPGERVLDIGAGTADLSILAAHRVGENGIVIAADLNEPMLQIGQSKLKRVARSARALADIVFLRTNAERLSLKDHSIDVVLTGFCMRNVADLDRALHEIFRVLKSNGRMVCLEFSRPTGRWLRSIYDFYSFTVLPVIGRSVSKDRTGVYQYLPDSIRKFPDQEAFSENMKKVGFRNVSYLNRSGGIVAIHIAEK